MTILNKRRLATAVAFVSAVALGAPLAWGMPPTPLGAASPAAAAPAHAPPTILDPVNALDTVFELEGDAVTGEFTSTDDWANILTQMGPPFTSLDPPAVTTLRGVTQCVGNTCNGTSFPGVLNRITANTIFTGGSTKDPLPLEGWLWKTGSVQPKDNIQDAYAAAYVLNENLSTFDLKNDVIIVFGQDRISNNGDAFLGFWFFKTTVDTNGPPGNGGTTHFGNGSGGLASHSVGDILVLMNFPQASFASPTVGAWEWVASGGDVSTNLKTVIAVGTATCDPTVDQEACGITNTGLTPITSPWPFQTVIKGVGANMFPQDSFFEGGINLSRLFRSLGQTIGCFGSFLAETRASESPSSTLSAFLLGKFNLCNMQPAKMCNVSTANATQTGFLWEYNGSVMNTGIGPLFDIKVYDFAPSNGPTPGSAQMQAGNPGNGLLVFTDPGPLNAGDTVNFGPQAPFPTPDLSLAPFVYQTLGSLPNPASDMITVTAASVSGGSVVLTKTATAQCPPVSLTPGMMVTKTCTGLDPTSTTGGFLGPFLAVVGGQVVVENRVNIHVCNTGQVDLVNVTVFDDDGTSTPTQSGLLSPDIALPIVAGVSTLPASGTPAANTFGTCADYTHTYTPPNFIGGPLPSTATLSDDATVSATPVLGFGNTITETRTVSPPCPVCFCPPGTTCLH